MIVVFPEAGGPVITILFDFIPRYRLNSETILPILPQKPYFECHYARLGTLTISMSSVMI